MEYKLTQWTIKKLVTEHEAGHINLSPPYQRNPIWTLRAQQKLIESILNHKPIPNFFLLEKGARSFEMIDGQQRARTILAYWKNLLVDHDHLTFQERLQRSGDRSSTRAQFLEDLLSITIVTKLQDNESVEEYYALLNSSGLRLNRPELKKAEYFTTNFLKLLLDLVADQAWEDIKIFTASNIARMNDVDFVSELVAALKFGISDKKEKVDQMYEDDITIDELKALRTAFKRNLSCFQRFNAITPLIRTRYKQKNDFYTLFHLFYTLRDCDVQTLDFLYRVLVKLGSYIRPSQDECEPLREYAHHCVTQSNSKLARQRRSEILTDILMNKTPEPNPIQEALLAFFDLGDHPLVNVGPFWTIDAGAIHDPHNYELEFTGDEIQS